MTTSDWGDWLPRRIATADPDGLACFYLGCNGLVLADGETTLFIDPYCGTGDPPRTVRMIPVPFDPADVAGADAVLATHEHTDHVHGPTQGPLLAGTDATYHAPAASLARVEREGWPETYDLSPDRFREVADGDRLELGALTVHVRSAHDPDAEQPVAYVLEHPAGTVIHGGDARPHERFAAIGTAFDIDLGFLAVGSVGELPDTETGTVSRTKWYSDIDEVVDAAGQLGVTRLVPTHWDVWRGLRADPDAVRTAAAGRRLPERVEVASIGDRVALTSDG